MDERSDSMMIGRVASAFGVATAGADCRPAPTRKGALGAPAGPQPVVRRSRAARLHNPSPVFDALPPACLERAPHRAKVRRGRRRRIRYARTGLLRASWL
eukprot:5705401-Prymnesium_polylepis.1